MISLLIVAILGGIIGAVLGSDKEMGSSGGFWLGFFLSLIGIIIVAFSRSKDPIPVQIVSEPKITAVEQLVMLNDLKDKGAISEDEYQSEKTKLLTGQLPNPVAQKVLIAEQPAQKKKSIWITELWKDAPIKEDEPQKTELYKGWGFYFWIVVMIAAVTYVLWNEFHL